MCCILYGVNNQVKKMEKAPRAWNMMRHNPKTPDVYFCVSMLAKEEIK